MNLSKNKNKYITYLSDLIQKIARLSFSVSVVHNIAYKIMLNCE